MTRANCPSCGAEIKFAVGTSVVVVCPHCQSAIARTDRKFTDIGKVAALADTESPLTIGLNGSYKGVSFLLTGRTQIKHFAGGVWDEWYIAFNDGRWGWLAEAHGEFYLTFDYHAAKLPAFDELHVDQFIAGVPGNFAVAEKGSGTIAGAEGEIPFQFTPGETYRYADLTNDHGGFATIDFRDDPPTFYIGKVVTLRELGFGHLDSSAPGAPFKREGVARIGCPNCGGSLTLHAPDKTERVACQYCGALLDAAQGVLTYLSALKPGAFKPLLPLGARAEFEGRQFTVIGFVVRSCVVEGTKYFWREYLLYAVELGFRWLVNSDLHWIYVKAIPAGAARERGRSAQYLGQTFKRFQDARGVVEYVSGEFYWKVAVGENVAMTDYVRAPYMLSREKTVGVGNRQVIDSEVNWSVGEYVTSVEMHKHFPTINFPAPDTIGPCQPFRHGGVYKAWAFCAAAAIVLIVLNRVTLPDRQIFNQTVKFQPMQSSEAGQSFFSEPIELSGNKNLYIQASAPVNNSWLSLDGDFINEDTGLVQAFALPVEYYYGVEDGESWSEGSRSNDTFVSALPQGKYTLRLEAQWSAYSQPMEATVVVRQGVPRAFNELILLGAVSLLPLIVLCYHWSFEMRRWKESMYNPYQTIGGDD